MTLPLTTGEFRCVADPTLRFSPSGVAVGKVRAVASSRKKDDNDNWVDDKTCWLDVVAFKRVAENMAESFEKGDLIVVTGKLQTEDWEDKDGHKRTSVSIIADVIGPALTFNPARIIKTERTGGQQSSQAPDPANDPWAVGPIQPEEAPF